MERYKIIFASDSDYFKHLFVCVSSLLFNNRTNLFDIHVITGESKNSFFEIFCNFLKVEPRINVFIHDISDQNLTSLKISNHFKISNYYRLFSEFLIDSEKALYLDSDIIVNNDLGDLFRIDLGDYFVAAVEDPGFTRHNDLKMDHNSKYFNSGVMLINLDKWRKENICDKVIKFVHDNPEAIRYVDQCGLNSVINGNWLELKPKYNQQSSFFKNFKNLCTNYFNENDILEAIKDPIVIHYTGTSKPWMISNIHPYRELYWKYRNLTPFKSFLADDFRIIKAFKWYPLRIYSFLRNF